MNAQNLAFTDRHELNEQDARLEGQRARLAAASLHLSNIHIGVNTVLRALQDRPAREQRALRWLGAYLARERLAPEAVSAQLDTDLPQIRAGLTNPAADVRRLVPKIESMRAIAESNIREPARTAFFDSALEAVDFAREEKALVEFVDITRTGKTTVADFVHLKSLDSAIYLNCPDDRSYSSFVIALAKACGIGTGSGKHGKKLHIFKRQIRAMFGQGKFDLLIIDEGHFLWPENLQSKPERIEMLRNLWDELKRQLAIVIFSTPQALVNSNAALRESKRWSPGQWEGRLTRFYPPESATDADVRKVVKWHCPDGDAEMTALLVAYARSSPGFYGSMENVLRRARFTARRSGAQLAATHIVKAIQEAARNTALGKKLGERKTS